MRHERAKAGIEGKRGLLLFLCLCIIFSWAIWLWPVDTPINTQVVISVNLFAWRIRWPLLNIKLIVGNCVPGLLAIIFLSVQGRERIGWLFDSIFAWKTAPRWYLFSVALPTCTFVAAASAAILFLPARLAWPPTSVLLNLLLSVFAGPLWEEIAWRAYFFRELRSRHSSLASALIVGVYWAIWHIPMWMLTLDYLTVPLLLIICLNLVAWSVIFSYLYTQSGQSLPVVILLHGVYLVVQGEIGAAFVYGRASGQHADGAQVVNVLQMTIVVATLITVCIGVLLAFRLRSDRNNPRTSGLPFRKTEQES